MECLIKRSVAICLLLVNAGGVLASPVCNVAKENWMSEPDLKQVLKRQGYLVKTVRIDNGCYEVYGLDPLGRRIQKHFDPATAKPASEPSRSAYAPP
jgi:hypothetical protein